MNDIPRQKLKQIISQNPTACQDAKLCEGLLRDFCGQYRQEINVLVSAIKEGVATDLLNSQNKVAADVLLPKLTTRLEDRWGMRPDVAMWGVDSFALALGVISQPRSIAIIGNNNQQNLAPTPSEDQQLIVTPTPPVPAPPPIPKTVYVWAALSTLAAIILGGAYYFQSKEVAELKTKLNANDEVTIIRNVSVNFCNQSSASTVSVAINYPIGNSQVRSMGWWDIERGECTQKISLDLDIQDRGEIYIYGEGIRTDKLMSSTNGEYSFCVTQGKFNKQFSSGATPCPENYRLVKAKKITLDTSINNSYTFSHPTGGIPGLGFGTLDIKPSEPLKLYDEDLETPLRPPSSF